MTQSEQDNVSEPTMEEWFAGLVPDINNLRICDKCGATIGRAGYHFLGKCQPDPAEVEQKDRAAGLYAALDRKLGIQNPEPAPIIADELPTGTQSPALIYDELEQPDPRQWLGSTKPIAASPSGLPQGLPYHIDYPRPRWAAVAMDKPTEPTSGTELSLLVIDLGDSCTIKVEKGEYYDEFHLQPKNDQGEVMGSISLNWISASTYHYSFAQIRAAIDEQFGEKALPVPRIERLQDGYGNDAGPWYRVYREDGQSETFQDASFRTITQLAGVEIPIWEAKAGVWTQLLPFQHRLSDGTPEITCEVDNIQIWRFEVKGTE